MHFLLCQNSLSIIVNYDKQELTHKHTHTHCHIQSGHQRMANGLDLVGTITQKGMHDEWLFTEHDRA